MGYDFNNASNQSEGVRGPVPEDSIVLLELKLEKPYQAVSQSSPHVGKTSTGLYQLNVSYKVISGRYEGYFWYDSILLPVSQQKAQLTQSQQQACAISETRVRAMIESARGVNPKDTSQQAREKRSIESWQDIDGMQFPAKLTINPKPRNYNGKDYWHNRIKLIITPDKPVYGTVMAGNEVINEGGAVTGTPVYRQPSGSELDFLPPQGTDAKMDDVPF